MYVRRVIEIGNQGITRTLYTSCARSREVRRTFFCTTHFLFENRSLIDFQIGNEPMGAILMKMVVFFFENAFCVGLFQSFYDGGDLDENGCFLY